MPKDCEHNAHMFYIKLKNMSERQKLIEFLKTKKISAVYHYIPLHSSNFGKKVGRFVGADQFTTKDSERLLRLPMYYGMGEKNVERVTLAVKKFLEM